jgi:hypothetical protein
MADSLKASIGITVVCTAQMAILKFSSGQSIASPAKLIMSDWSLR